MGKCYPTVDKDYEYAIDRARNRLRSLIAPSTIAPLMLRLAWHSAVTCNNMISGANNDPDIVESAVRLLKPLKELYHTISYGDFYQLAGVVAVECTRGPHVPFHPGRKDKIEPPYGGDATQAGGHDHCSDVSVKTVGLNAKDIVLLCGARTLGRCKRGAYISFSPEIDHGEPFGNIYFKDLLDWAEKRCFLVKSEKELLTDSVFRDTAVNYSYDDDFFYSNDDRYRVTVNDYGELLLGKENGLLQLPSDVELLTNDLFKPYVQKYANDIDAFFEDYPVSHMKLSELGFAEA